MEINTPASIASGRRIHRAFGSWEKAREAAVQGDDGLYRIPRERLHGIPSFGSITEDVPLLDRLIALLEVSPLATVPFSLSILSVWPLFLLVYGFQALSGVQSAVPVIVVAACWCVVAGFDVARNVWTMQHPYASPRWLRGVHAAVGDDLAVRALAYLIRRYDHEPDYVVKRSDMLTAVQVEREERREARRRAEGFRLVEAPGLTRPEPEALADPERRRRARERRAARAACTTP